MKENCEREGESKALRGPNNAVVRVPKENCLQEILPMLYICSILTMFAAAEICAG